MDYNQNKRVFFIAGEHSGDLQGSLVIKHIKKNAPNIIIEGIGGPLMQKAGMNCLHSIDELAVIGFVEVLKNITQFLAILNDVKNYLVKNKPDLLVLIDFPGFNTKVAKFAKQHKIKVLYYIPPQVWAWNPSRAKYIANLIDEAIVVFPFELKIWRNAGAKVNWFGHPLVGTTTLKQSLQDFKKAIGINNEQVVSLLPGSRLQEINYILPKLLDTAEIIINKLPNTRFLLPLAGTIPEDYVFPFFKNRNLPLTFVKGQTYEAVAISDLAIVASGTATLETALIGTPMIIVYQTNFITSIISKFLIRKPFIGLPNVIAGRQIVPEFIRWKFTSTNVANEAISILKSPRRQQTIRDLLAQMVVKLGPSGASERVANHIVKILQNQ